jgi:G3E family GTPase
VTFEFKKRVPVSVIGGFLGAGKTTLVNHLIRSGGYQFGVIVNEFGDTGVDGSLIEQMEDDGVAELSNGCLCCYGREDLVAALVNLAMRETPPEYVLIELSGVADPVPVAQTVLDPMLKSLFELDGIIGVADARNLMTTLQQNPEGAVQLAYASAVILNKIDLADAHALTQAKTIIRQLNPLTSILEVERGAVDPRLLLDTHAFEPRWETDYAVSHTADLSSFTLCAETPLPRAQFNRFVEQMIVARPGDVLRVKGHVCIDGFDQKILFQAVRELFSMNLIDSPNDGRSQLVVIGRGLEQTAFKQAFMPVLVSEQVTSVGMQLDIDES